MAFGARAMIVKAKNIVRISTLRSWYDNDCVLVHLKDKSGITVVYMRTTELLKLLHNPNAEMVTKLARTRTYLVIADNERRS